MEKTRRETIEKPYILKDLIFENKEVKMVKS